MAKRFWILLGGAALVTGCRIVDDKLPEPTAPAVTAPGEPAAPPASSPPAVAPAASPGAAPPAASPAEPPASGPAAPAPAASGTAEPASAPTASAPAAAPAEPPPGVLDAVANAAAEAAGQKPTDGPGATTAVGADVAKASRASLAAAAAAAAAAKVRQAAQDELAEQQRRRELHLRSAQYHLEFGAVRVREGDAERALLHLALLGQSLAGVRANLGRGVVQQELSFALAALYNFQQVSTDQDAAVKVAVEHLRRAQAALPAVPSGPAGSVKPSDEASEQQPSTAQASLDGAAVTGDPAVLAREVADLVKLLLQQQRSTGRERLQALVLELSASEADALLELLEAARRNVVEALATKSLKRAASGLDRLGKLLAELPTALPAAAPSAAPSGPAGSATGPAPAPREAPAAPAAPSAAAPPPASPL
ncbi:MAG: hypothetical protein IT204_12885 [Fimbriimonadaceae bacterium]|nr:hypothetical protein [Fimbriimonadaceae bacterium]